MINTISSDSSDLENKISYFKETSISGYLSIYDYIPPLKNILSQVTNIKILSTKFCMHDSTVSNEGQIFTGFHLIVNYAIIENFKYSTFDSNDILFFSFSEHNNYFSIMLPEYINNIYIEDIINSKLYSLSFNLENVDLDIINEKTIFYNFTSIFTFNITNIH